VRATSVDTLELSVRAANGLINAGCKTIGDIIDKSPNDLLRVKNFGRKSLKELQEVLGELYPTP
jgi:DNA-directed RNA polymerase subunit alpha